MPTWLVPPIEIQSDRHNLVFIEKSLHSALSGDKDYIYASYLDIWRFLLLVKTSPEKLSLTSLDRPLTGTAYQLLCHQTPKKRLFYSHDTAKVSTKPWLWTRISPSDLKEQISSNWSRPHLIKQLSKDISTRLLGNLSLNMWWWHNSGDLDNIWTYIKFAREFSLLPLLVTQMWPLQVSYLRTLLTVWDSIPRKVPSWPWGTKTC